MPRLIMYAQATEAPAIRALTT